MRKGSLLYLMNLEKVCANLYILKVIKHTRTFVLDNCRYHSSTDTVFAMFCETQCGFHGSLAISMSNRIVVTAAVSII